MLAEREPYYYIKKTGKVKEKFRKNERNLYFVPLRPGSCEKCALFHKFCEKTKGILREKSKN